MTERQHSSLCEARLARPPAAALTRLLCAGALAAFGAAAIAAEPADAPPPAIGAPLAASGSSGSGSQRLNASDAPGAATNPPQQRATPRADPRAAPRADRDADPHAAPHAGPPAEPTDRSPHDGKAATLGLAVPPEAASVTTHALRVAGRKLD